MLPADGGADAGGWPWGNYETRLLRALADAVRQFWSTYDPADPSTAPKQPDVSKYIQERHKVSETMADMMATIIRADGAPQGRRKGAP